MVIRVILITAAIFVNSFLPVLSSPAKNSIAFITDVKGNVTIKQGRSERKITHVALLYEGDVVSTGDNGEALLWQVYSRVEPIKPKTSKPISQLPRSSEPGVLDLDRYLKLESKILSSVKDVNRPSPRKQGGSEDALFLVLSPRFSLVLDNRPTFEWTPLKGATSYVVALYDGSENKLWEETTKENRITYPDHSKDQKARLLLPGKYKWDVTAKINQKSVEYDAAEFTIASDVESKKIQAALSDAKKLVDINEATNLIYIAVCLEYQQYPEAEAAIKQAMARNPEDQMLKILLLQVYEYMQRPDEREDMRVAFKDSKVSDLEVQFGIREIGGSNK